MILPLVYFSSLSLGKYKIRPLFAGSVNFILGGFLLFLMLSPNVAIPELRLENPSIYMIETDECMLSTNRWIYFNYLGMPSFPNPRESRISEYVDKGYRIIIFSDPEPDYARNVSFLREFPVIGEGSNYVMIGDESVCLEPYVINRTYHEYLNESIFAEYGYPIEKDPLKIVISGRY